MARVSDCTGSLGRASSSSCRSCCWPRPSRGSDARVDVAQQAPSDVPQPDFIIVERFGVSPEDVKLDRGLSAQALRGLQERALNDEERKVGAAVATVMEEETVRLLREAGIPAYVDSYAPTATRTTALLQGQFLSVDEGDRTQRVWLGFGLGAPSCR
jgi:Domain of unknown function (DUF4410)